MLLYKKSNHLIVVLFSFLIILLVTSSTFSLVELNNSTMLRAAAKFSNISHHVENNYAVGSLPGELRINPVGAAVYTIPITVSPGTAGMAPALSIEYNSGHKNGLLGIGFSLQGLTSITRTSQTKVINGKVHAIDFSNDDRFELNGEQLVAIKGEYGADQTEYRTYKNTFAKIISYGKQGNGPEKFKVWTKSGQVAEYAYTDDSKVKTQAKDTVAVWALNKVQDSVGNYLTVHYLQDESKGAFYPDGIEYTGNDEAGLKPYNKVKLVYQDRKDVITRYRAGSKTIIDKLLNEIQIYSQNQLIYIYKLTYKESLSTQRSYLSSIQQCATSGECLLPTKFDWSRTQMNDWEAMDDYIPPVPTTKIIERAYNFPNGTSFVDLNGNGLPDIIQHTIDGDKGAWVNTGKGWKNIEHYVPPVKLVKDRFAKDNGVRFVDLNGDGLVDIVQYTGSGEKGAWINNGEDWQEENDFIPPISMTTSDDKNNGARFIDLDGDGRKELVRAFKDGSKGVWKNNGHGWEQNDEFIPPVKFGSESGARLLDLNGDGLPDIVQSEREKVYGTITRNIWINTGLGWKQIDVPGNIPFFLDNVYHTEMGLRMVDFNGSGRVGILNHPSGFSGDAIGHKRIRAGLLTTITNGLGVEATITYKPLTDPDVYAKENNAMYPNIDMQVPMYVVSQTSSDTDNNDPTTKERSSGQHVTNYYYTGAKFNASGWGFLGFHKVTKTDLTTGLNEVTSYDQNPDRHVLQRPLLSETRLIDGTLINSKQTKWEVKIFGDGLLDHTYYFPYASQTIQNQYTLEGVFKNSKIITTQIDDYGNPLSIEGTVKDESGSYITKTKNKYENNLEKWHLGELINVNVTSIAAEQVPLMRESAFSYDANTGLLKQTVVEPNDSNYKSSKSFKRDKFGNIIETTIAGNDIDDRVTKVKYDQTGRFIIAQTNPLGNLQEKTIEPKLGKTIQTKDFNGLIMRYKYDDFGRLIQTISPDEKIINQKLQWYNHVGESNSLKDPLFYAVYLEAKSESGGATAITYYDKLNREVAKTTQGLAGQAIWQTTQYDDLGRAVQQSVPYYAGEQSLYSRIDYDVLGRIIKTTKANGSIVEVKYDEQTTQNGVTTLTINPLGQKTIKKTDERGNIVEIYDNQNHVVHYQYDSFGNMTKMIDSAGNITEIVYDKLHRKIMVDDPDKGRWRYKYNVLGELISETNAKGQATVLKYDKLGRMISRADSAGISTWEYDTATHGVGRLAKVSGIAGLHGQAPNDVELTRAAKDGLVNYTKQYIYDELSRPIAEVYNVNGQCYKKQVIYDSYSRPKEIIYPSGFKIKRCYNELGYLVMIKSAENDMVFWQANSMDAQGHLTSVSHGNGLITESTYDVATGFVTDIKTSSGDNLRLQQNLFPKLSQSKLNHNHFELGSNVLLNNKSESLLAKNTLVQDLHYTYDNLGKIVQRQNNVTNREEEFKYDSLNRLINASDSKGDEHIYAYDELGNITFKSDIGDYAYGQNGAGPHAVTNIKGTMKASFIYDANGNQTNATINGESRNISYTSYDKPKEIKTAKAAVNFYYNADRSHFERLDQTADETVTTLYLGDYVLETHNGKNKLITEQKYYIGPNTLYVKDSDGKEEAYYLLKDNLGSLTVITDHLGNVVQRFHYMPFGLQEKVIGKDINDPITHKGFTGHEELEKVKLVHMDGSLYDPILGRFLSADPLIQAPDNTQSLNRYSYCLNDPLTLTDPSGYGWFSDLIDDIIDIFHDIGHAIDELFRDEPLVPFLEVIVGSIATTIGAPIGGMYWMPALLNAAITNAMGGNLRDIIASVVFSEVNTLAWQTTGDFLQASNATLESRVMVHGIVGGTLSGIEGRGFTDGFLSSIVSEVACSRINNIGVDADGIIGIAARTASASIIGGTVASITGGNFINGAETAAYAELFNDLSEHTANYFRNSYYKEERLIAALGINGVTFGVRPLEFSLKSFMFDNGYMKEHNREWFHEQLFWTDSEGHLYNEGFFKGEGIASDSKFPDNIGSYRFGPVYKRVVNYFSVHMSGFRADNYNFLKNNCHVYSNVVRINLNIPPWQFKNFWG